MCLLRWAIIVLVKNRMIGSARTAGIGFNFLDHTTHL